MKPSHLYTFEPAAYGVRRQAEPDAALAANRNSTSEQTWRCAPHPTSLHVLFALGFALYFLGSFPLRAQPANVGAQDPLITLMQSQPRIEVNGPVSAVAAFDPPIVRPGESATYRITFTALEESIELPDLPTPKELAAQRGAHGQMLQMTGPTMIPMTTFNYQVRTSTNGEFTIPEFVAQVYGKPVTVPAARLAVAPTLPPSLPPALHLQLEAPVTNVFVGQAVRVRILLPGLIPGLVQSLSQVQLTGPGFVVDQGAVHQRIEAMPRGGTSLATYVYETTLIPIETGKLSVFAQGFTSGSRFAGQVVINGSALVLGGQQPYTLLESEPVSLNVRPLPREGALTGFTGAIGAFSVDPPSLASNVLRVGDPVKLTITIRGGTNFSRIVPPPAPRVEQWQVFAASANPLPPQVLQAQGFASFDYTLIPLTEEARATPAIPFSCFDPNRGAYTDLTIPSIPVLVKPGAVPAEFSAFAQAEAAIQTDKEPALSGLAFSPGRSARSLAPLQRQRWFPAVQLFPAVAFFGLWTWDRRRRYLEQHPDVVLRQRARRALRRERRALRQAARKRDAAGFASAAVSAMRVACAPHFPAEPRALVGSDVLHLLQEKTVEQPSDSKENGQRQLVPVAHWEQPPGARLFAPEASSTLPPRTIDVVRRFFGMTDATRFATASADATELLTLEPELERVLQQLEAKL